MHSAALLLQLLIVSAPLIFWGYSISARNMNISVEKLSCLHTSKLTPKKFIVAIKTIFIY